MSVPHIQSSLESRTPMMLLAAVQIVLAIGFSSLVVATDAAGGDVFKGLEDKTYLGEFKFTTHQVQGQVCIIRQAHTCYVVFLPTERVGVQISAVPTNTIQMGC